MTDSALPCVDDLAALALRLADPHDALGLAAREAITLDGALSPPMADRVLRTTLARYTPEALRALCNGSLAGRDVLVVLANSVPTAPLRAIALPLLRGAKRVRVKPSRHPSSFLAVLQRAAPFDHVQAIPELEPVPGEHVMAYGTDTALGALRARLGDGASFEGYGHGMGVAIVAAPAGTPSQGTPSQGLTAIARALARDVADYDQRGCLSPQAVYLVGNSTEAVALAHALHAALASELPRGPLDPAEAARVMQWQGVTALRSTVFLRGVQHAVAVLETAVQGTSPGARCIAVVPVPSLAALADLLRPDAAHLTCVGTAGLDAAIPLPAGASPRVVPLGTMQDPALDGPEDPRPPRR